MLWVAGDATRANAYGKYDPSVYIKGTKASLDYWGPTWSLADDAQRIRRKGLGYKGRGDYKSWGKYVPRAVGALGGGLAGFRAGGLMGGYEGARAGWDAGAGFSKAIGLGDYGVSTNQIIASGGSIPSMNETNLSGDIMWSNTEFVQNISCSATAAGTSGFQLTKFSLNPGLETTFPFLAQIANNFELYDFVGLMFIYKPTSGEFGNNNSNSLGKVVLCTNYDPAAPSFSNSVVMENYDYANSCRPCDMAYHGVETNPSQRSTQMLYTRNGTVSRDLIFTDIGSFFIATEGVPFSAAGTQQIGELWVSYGIKLSRARLFDAIGQNNNYFIANGGTNATGTNWTVSLNFAPGNNIEVVLGQQSATAQNLTFAASNVPRRLLISYQVNASTSVATGWPQAFTIPAAAGTLIRSQGQSSVAGQVWVVNYLFQIPSSVTPVVISNTQPAALAGTNFTWKLHIVEVDPDFDFGPTVLP